MGGSASRARNHHSGGPIQPHKITVETDNTSSGLFEFFVLLSDGMPKAINIPSCWDEILDWCETVDSALVLSMLTAEASNDTQFDVSPGLGDLQFVPMVLADRKDRLALLPQMEWLEASSFYSQGVSLHIPCRDPMFHSNAGNSTPRQVVIRVKSSEKSLCEMGFPVFSRYHSLLCRFVDLMLLLHQNGVAPDTELCLICHTDHEASVLECGHSLCQQCEKRWVRKKLSCPFCRTRFANRRAVDRDGWELTEWSRDDLNADIEKLEQQIQECLKTTTPDGTKAGRVSPEYVECPRSLDMSEPVDEDDVVLVHWSDTM